MEQAVSNNNSASQAGKGLQPGPAAAGKTDRREVRGIILRIIAAGKITYNLKYIPKIRGIRFCRIRGSRRQLKTKETALGAVSFTI